MFLTCVTNLFMLLLHIETMGKTTKVNKTLNRQVPNVAYTIDCALTLMIMGLSTYFKPSNQYCNLVT